MPESQGELFPEEEPFKILEKSNEPNYKPRTSHLNDIDLKRWKDYPEIVTDSLWLFPGRDKSGVHEGDYWGNFIPQIATQSLLRFTKRGEVVLDTFLGSGTTLIECKRLGRNGIGVEISPRVAEIAEERISQETNNYDVKTKVIVGDSGSIEVKDKIGEALAEMGQEKAQLLIIHPPYYDIIKFSDLEEDLSNAESEEDFYNKFKEVVENVSDFLERDRYLVLVIGDKYENGEWIPLGFRAMEITLNCGYKLKSICIKDIQENRGKRNQLHLWRYRALAGGFYIFKHEYIIFFIKT